LIGTVQELDQCGVGFRSLTEQIDTTTPGGTLIFHVFGALSQFERALIVERTQAGLAAARARGRSGGRPRGTTRYQGFWPQHAFTQVDWDNSDWHPFPSA
jgi:DNA invertase Pin-like site-specific DNA recombinase